jgi:hypothetical protein
MYLYTSPLQLFFFPPQDPHTPLTMSASTTGTCPLIAGRDILLLVRGYARDNLEQWGHVGLLTQVFGQDPHIHTIDWAIDELAAQLVCVVNANSPESLILRILVTPEFLWLGLHAVPLSVASKSTEAPLPMVFILSVEYTKRKN